MSIPLTWWPAVGWSVLGCCPLSRTSSSSSASGLQDRYHDDGGGRGIGFGDRTAQRAGGRGTDEGVDRARSDGAARQARQRHLAEDAALAGQGGLRGRRQA